MESNFSCALPGDHSGRVHAYEFKKVAELDGTPVNGARWSEVLICEGHYPDKDDPKFTLCSCRLCRARRKSQN